MKKQDKDIGVTKIYLVENCFGDPNKVYIGKTKKSRKNSHKQTYGKQIEYTYIDEINSLDYKDWEPLESYWIEQFRQWGFEIMNVRKKGGSGPSKWSDGLLNSQENQIRKEKIRKTKLGKPFPSAREANTGNTYRKGKNMSLDSKLKISEANKGRKHSPEKRKNMGAPKGKKQEEKSIQQRIKNLNKSIMQYDLDGNFIKEWSSIKQARTDTKSTNIAANLSGKVKQTNGYIWKYKEK